MHILKNIFDRWLYSTRHGVSSTSRLLNYVKIRNEYKCSCHISLKLLLENSLYVRSIFIEFRSTCVETRHILHSKWYLKSPSLNDIQNGLKTLTHQFRISWKFTQFCSCFSRVHVAEWNEFNSYAVGMLSRQKRRELVFDFILELLLLNVNTLRPLGFTYGMETIITGQ
jgi:hypothetical protein